MNERIENTYTRSGRITNPTEQVQDIQPTYALRTIFYSVKNVYFVNKIWVFFKNLPTYFRPFPTFAEMP